MDEKYPVGLVTDFLQWCNCLSLTGEEALGRIGPCRLTAPFGSCRKHNHFHLQLFFLEGQMGERKLRETLFYLFGEPAHLYLSFFLSLIILLRKYSSSFLPSLVITLRRLFLSSWKSCPHQRDMRPPDCASFPNLGGWVTFHVAMRDVPGEEVCHKLLRAKERGVMQKVEKCAGKGSVTRGMEEVG